MIKIGTIGSGFIVDGFISAVKNTEGMEINAVYSRTLEKAREFAEKHGVEKFYDSLEAMMSDEEINFIYVASPNSLHYPQSLLALENGKNVICEKPFVPTEAEARNLYDVAKEKGLFIFEAIMPVHLPNVNLIKEKLPELGRIRIVQANFSQYSSRYDKLLAGQVTNAFDPAFAGGALGDINIYNLHFTCWLFGFPKKVHYYPNLWENGIDTSGILILQYEDFVAELVGCKDSTSESNVQIQGEKGYIKVNSQASLCMDFDLVIPKEKRKGSYSLQGSKDPAIASRSDFASVLEKNPMEYELEDFRDIYEAKDFKKCYDLLEYSCKVMGVYEEARKSGGVIFTNK